MSPKFNSPKLKLTPLQRDLLWILEEAGSETLQTIVASIEYDDIAQLELAVRELHRMGLVAFYRDLGYGGATYTELQTIEIKSLPSFQDMVMNPIPMEFTGIMLTRAGNDAIET